MTENSIRLRQQVIIVHTYGLKVTLPYFIASLFYFTVVIPLFSYRKSLFRSITGIFCWRRASLEQYPYAAIVCLYSRVEAIGRNVEGGSIQNTKCKS